MDVSLILPNPAAAEEEAVKTSGSNKKDLKDNTDDDDFDLFGSDEEDSQEAERIKQERREMYAAKKAKSECHLRRHKHCKVLLKTNIAFILHDNP